MTFKPRFEDFESVTKAIGDGSQVNQLLVHVYEEGTSSLDTTYTFEIKNCSIKDQVQIPFYYGKKYEVYFWAYKSGENSPYTISETGLKGGVSVNYPTDSLGFNALESLDAFYAVSEDVDLSNGRTIDVNLTRPFAQVNLVANMADLATAQATMVEFKINVATSFVPGATPATTAKKTFTFDSDNHFQDNDPIEPGKVYLGTTYLFVPESGTLMGELNIYSGKKVLKSASNVEIPLASNKRTNLVFSGIVPSVPDWDDTKDDTAPTAGSDGWIHISTPEQLAALLRTGVTSETKVHICKDLDMTNMPDDVKAEISDKSFTNLILDGAHYSGTLENHTVPETSVDGGAYKIKNFEGPAFLANATNLKVRNLGLEKVHITHNDEDETRHVGTLVNTLKGTSAFTNVQVKESYASTLNGAAGGVVGYIVRTSETNRAEPMEVKFDNCSIEGSKIMHTAAGTEAEGKFVGLFSGYDNGEKLVFTSCSADANATVADYSSRYVEGNEGAWLAGNNYSAYNGFLGDEKYLRGKVYFGGEDEAKNRFCPKWDGTTNTTKLDIEPLLANATYDAGTTAGANRYVVYSPFDLAGVRKKTASPAAIYIKADIDLNGQGVDGRYNVPSNFTKSAHSSADDNVFDPFSSVTTLDGYRDASTNNSIYNLSIAQIEQERAAFILSASGTTVHKNINFRNCQTVAVHKPKETDAKAYGAILVSNVDATYTMENVHAYDCKVFALQKIGTLGARISGTSTLKNNSVNNCYVENYECLISERFDSGTKEALGMQVRVYADFYPHGEVGGMYGFIQDASIVSGCHVNNTIVHGYGQNDKKATIEGDGAAQAGIAILGYFLVPGRHVSTFIGNIRATGAINITNCKVDSSSKCTNRWDTHQWRVNTGSFFRPSYKYYKYDYIGQAYYVEFVDSKGSVTVDGAALTLGDCKDGTLYGTK